MLDNTVGEAVTEKWLRAVHGDDVAALAMCVPWELRAQLYPEVFTYGPAFREVQEFFEAVDESTERVTFYDAVSRVWGKLTKLYQGKALLHGSPDEDQFLHDVLVGQANRMFTVAHGAAMIESVGVVALALSADWLDQSARDAFAPMLVEMNALLNAVGLPALRTLDATVVRVPAGTVL